MAHQKLCEYLLDGIPQNTPTKYTYQQRKSLTVGREYASLLELQQLSQIELVDIS